MDGQRGALGDGIVSSRDYLELAKPIVAADGTTRSVSRPGTAATKAQSVESSANAIADSSSTAVAIVSESTTADEGLVAEYKPQPPNRHLHIRDTLILALRVLEVNKRDGHALTSEEQQLVDSIAACSQVR